MGGPRQGRPMLALVPELSREPAPIVAFCGHCGARPAGSTVQEASSRVCGELRPRAAPLQASADAAPVAGGAFIVLDSAMAVCAVSRAAEDLLATSETGAVNRHVTQLIVPADWRSRARRASPGRSSGPREAIRRPARSRSARRTRSAFGSRPGSTPAGRRRRRWWCSRAPRACEPSLPPSVASDAAGGRERRDTSGLERRETSPQERAAGARPRAHRFAGEICTSLLHRVRAQARALGEPEEFDGTPNAGASYPNSSRVNGVSDAAAGGPWPAARYSY